MSKIEWTDSTWNPTTGCTKVSAGCKHCYAESLARRLQAMGVNGYENGFKISLMPERLNRPRSVRKPTRFFVNSMSDLFHPSIPGDYIDKIMKVIGETPRHQYQILTKRAKAMSSFFSKRVVPHNAWLGVTVENKKDGIPRIGHLRKTNATIRFLSIEPLLEELGELDLEGISWAIVGGESGPKARPMEEAWVDSIHSQCNKQDVKFFFKQWGTWGPDGVRRSKQSNGRTYKHKLWNLFPASK